MTEDLGHGQNGTKVDSLPASTPIIQQVPDERPPITEEQRQKFRRRILNAPSTLNEPPLLRRFDVFNLVLTFAGGFYMVMYADFGPKEHLFTPLRRWYFNKLRQLTTLNANDIAELQKQGKL